MISGRFIKHSFIYTVAGSLPMASAILLMPFYVAGLSTASFGSLSLFLAFSILVQLLVTYSFDASLYIHYHEYKGDTEKLNSFISSTFLFMVIIGSALFVLFLLFGEMMFSVFLGKNILSFFPFGIFAVLGGSFQALFKVHSSLLQTQEKPQVYLYANTLLFSAIVLLTVLGLHFFPDTLIGPLGGRALALIVGGIWILFRVYRNFGLHFNFSLLFQSFGFNFYSFIYQIQQWAINYLDRFVLVLFLPLSTIGIYDFAIKCLVIIEFLMNGLVSSFFPTVVKELISKEEKGTSILINRYYHGLVAVVVLLVCLAIVFLPPTIQWFATYLGCLNYLDSINLIPYLAALFLIRVIRIYFSFPYSVLKYIKPLPTIYLVSTIVKFLSLYLLVPRIGIEGVIWSSCFSLFFDLILLRLYLPENFNFKINPIKIIVTPLLLFLFIIIIEKVSIPLSLYLKSFAYIVFTFGLLFFVYKNDIKKLKIPKW